MSALVLGRKFLGTVKVPEQDRGNTYLVGGSGTGKSRQLFNLAVQQLERGESFGVVDVHGDLNHALEKAVYALIPGRAEKQRRVTLLDPTRGAFGFNPLEIPEGEDPYPFVLEIESLFEKLWADAWGERMADMLRNSCLVLAEQGLTFCELPRLLTDGVFRQSLIEDLANAAAREYFELRFNRLPKREQSTWIESTLNKVNQFIGSPVIRDIVGQRHSTINLRQVIDAPGAVLLITLPKGTMKSNAFLLGALLISKLQEAALSRANLPEDERQRFTLIIDECQHFGLGSLNFQECLSEARKYGLSMVLAHQNCDQLNEKLLASILGNTTVQMSFRVQRKDAELVGKELFKVDIPDLAWEREQGLSSLSLRERWEDHFNQLTQLRPRQAHVVIKGRGSYRVRTLDTPVFSIGEDQLASQAHDIMSRYCRPREEIRRELEERSRRFDALGDDGITLS